MPHHLVAEISAGAIRANLALLRERTGPGVKLFAVVKADAYGHGLELLLPVIGPGVDGLAVTTYGEAARLRDLGYTGSVLVFYTPATVGTGRERDEVIADLIGRGIVFTVATESDVRALARVAAERGRRARVHLKIDTGMNRSGSPAGAAAPLLLRLRDEPAIDVTGAYTHFATADEADTSFVPEQLERFLKAVDKGGGREGLTLHAANSAALLRWPETHLDLVRPGLAVYGYDAAASRDRPALRPCLRLVASLAQIKEVVAGERTGYGLTHRFERATRIGLVPVGYADGYPAALANRSVVAVTGRHAPVRGRVSMDQIVVDLAELEEAGVGTAVEIVSPDPAQPHSIEELARLSGTIPYELIVRLGARIHRRLVD